MLHFFSFLILPQYVPSSPISKLNPSCPSTWSPTTHGGCLPLQKYLLIQQICSLSVCKALYDTLWRKPRKYKYIGPLCTRFVPLGLKQASYFKTCQELDFVVQDSTNLQSQHGLPLEYLAANYRCTFWT